MEAFFTKQLHQYGNVYSQKEKAMEYLLFVISKRTCACVCVLCINHSSQADLLQGPPQEQKSKRLFKLRTWLPHSYNSQEITRKFLVNFRQCKAESCT